VWISDLSCTMDIFVDISKSFKLKCHNEDLARLAE